MLLHTVPPGLARIIGMTPSLPAAAGPVTNCKLLGRDVQPPWAVTVVMYVHVHRSRKALSIARYQILNAEFPIGATVSSSGCYAIMEHNG